MKKYIVEIDEHGNRFWKNKDGLLHREDGPAVEGVNGDKEWWLNGNQVSQEEVEQLIYDWVWIDATDIKKDFHYIRIGLVTKEGHCQESIAIIPCENYSKASQAHIQQCYNNAQRIVDALNSQPLPTLGDYYAEWATDVDGDNVLEAAEEAAAQMKNNHYEPAINIIDRQGNRVLVDLEKDRDLLKQDLGLD